MTIRHSSVLFLAALLGTANFSSLSASDQPPRAISQFTPAYPYEMLKIESEGAVLVSFNITAQGDVTNATVISSTKRIFEAPTLHAIKQWKFTPGMKDGVAIGTPMTQLVTFVVLPRKASTTTASLVAKLRPRRSDSLVASPRQPGLTAGVSQTTASRMNLSSTLP